MPNDGWRKEAQIMTSKSGTELRDGDYYDDSDNDAGGSNTSSRDDRMYRSACSFGQFLLNPCLCVFMTCQGCYHRARLLRLENSGRLPLATKRPRSRPKLHLRFSFVENLLAIGILSFTLVGLYIFGIVSSSELSRDLLIANAEVSVPRIRFDDDPGTMRLRIPNLDFKNTNNDIGGWNFVHQFNFPTIEIKNDSKLDFGGLRFVGPAGEKREPRADEEKDFNNNFRNFHPDKHKVNQLEQFADDIADEENACKRQNWVRQYFPTCNTMHAMDVDSDYRRDIAGLGDEQMLDSFFINNGYFRDVWVVEEANLGIKHVLKTTRWKHDFDSELLLGVLKDALIMERLTPSPRVVDIWSHCGTSVSVEALPFEVEDRVVPGDGYIKQVDLQDEDELNPQNDYTASEKLDIALQMARSVADLHGFQGGLIVHDDIQLCQWLRTRNGPMKIGDFNRAEFPDFDPEKGEYCKYNNGPAFGNYRSPEEFDAKDLDEKIDIFSFGNNIYGLLTGLWVFYENTDDEVVQEKVIAGKKAFVDPRYRKRSFIEGKLVDVMEQCWAYKPEDRIDIFEVVRQLEDAKAEADRLPDDPPP